MKQFRFCRRNLRSKYITAILTDAWIVTAIAPLIRKNVVFVFFLGKHWLIVIRGRFSRGTRGTVLPHSRGLISVSLNRMRFFCAIRLLLSLILMRIGEAERIFSVLKTRNVPSCVKNTQPSGMWIRISHRPFSGIVREMHRFRFKTAWCCRMRWSGQEWIISWSFIRTALTVSVLPRMTK